eukprot:scaffold8404_cov305-Pinguiococcus_pyrenoidosus.AAC.6
MNHPFNTSRTLTRPGTYRLSVSGTSISRPSHSGVSSDSMCLHVAYRFCASCVEIKRQRG